MSRLERSNILVLFLITVIAAQRSGVESQDNAGGNDHNRYLQNIRCQRYGYRISVVYCLSGTKALYAIAGGIVCAFSESEASVN